LLSDLKGLHLYVGLGFNPSTGVDNGGTVVYSIDPVTGMLAVNGSAGTALSRAKASPSILEGVSSSMAGDKAWNDR